jgi:hypothetical protein
VHEKTMVLPALFVQESQRAGWTGTTGMGGDTSESLFEEL